MTENPDFLQQKKVECQQDDGYSLHSLMRELHVIHEHKQYYQVDNVCGQISGPVSQKTATEIEPIRERPVLVEYEGLNHADDEARRHRKLVPQAKSCKHEIKNVQHRIRDQPHDS